MRPHIRRVKCIIRFFALSAGSLVILSIIVMKETSITELAELDKCPACFGKSFCPSIHSGQVHLYPFASWFNAKNVFFAHSSTDIFTLKKLGHDWELAALDEYICQLMGHDLGNCVISDIIWRLQDVKSVIFNVVQSNKTIRSRFTFCPAVDPTQIDELIDRVYTKSKDIGYKTMLINILTTLVINPEPIILQAFPADEGWPFPHHLGSCGRLTVQQYAGLSVGRFLSSPWLARANIALQLLQAARQLTFQDPRYALYITDLSLDNIAVDKSGKLSIIDLGNIIIVDKFPPLSARPLDWRTMHTSDTIEDCDSCFAFSTDDLCSHQTSDHNYYAVCQFMAENLWLENPPENVLRSYPQLKALLRECRSPEMTNGRYVAVRHLIPILANLTAWHVSR